MTNIKERLEKVFERILLKDKYRDCVNDELLNDLAQAILTELPKMLPEKKITHTTTHINEDADFALGWNAYRDEADKRLRGEK